MLGEPSSVPPTAMVIVNTDIGMVQQLQNTPGSIGYASITSAGEANLNIIALNRMAPLPILVKQNRYKFWTVERLYTKGQPSPNSLTAAFLQYIQSDYAKTVATSQNYITSDEMSSSTPVGHGS
jgi:ABC-type phosphate transport system substrate-binding protein